MRSSRRLLANKLKHEGDHDRRLAAIAVEAPDEYSCSILFTVMNNPVNLSAPGEEHHYIDQNVYLQLLPKPLNTHYCMASEDDFADPKTGRLDNLLKNDDGSVVHAVVDPFTNKGIFHEITIDQSLKAIISTYVFAEEIHAHLKQLAIQHEQGLSALHEMSDAQVDTTLFFLHADDVVAAFGFPANHIPQKFFCAVNKDRVMTFPVRIDGHVVDFYVLINQPKPKEFADSPHVYFNPFTGQPLHQLDAEYDLLNEIDEFLGHITLHDQMTVLTRRITYHERQFNKLRPALSNKSFEEILREEKFPEKMIPADLLLFNPGSNIATVFTHPVLLDGIHPVDYKELMTFWKQKPENWGVNPWTGTRVKTIALDENLREDSVQFIVNPEYYKVTPFKRRNRGQAKKEWGFNPAGKSKFSIGFGMYSRRDQQIGLAGLAVDQKADADKQVSSPENTNNKGI